MSITNNEFYSIVACISRLSATWEHEGVVMKLARGKGEDAVVGDGPSRFCNELREYVSEIEACALTSNDHKDAT